LDFFSFIVCNDRMKNKIGVNDQWIHSNVRREIDLHHDVRGEIFDWHSLLK
jgi:hypothetical protein